MHAVTAYFWNYCDIKDMHIYRLMPLAQTREFDASDIFCCTAASIKKVAVSTNTAIHSTLKTLEIRFHERFDPSTYA